MEKKSKTKEEWKKLIRDILSPQEFQDLCEDLVKRNGFKNVKQRGKAGDGGRDLEGDLCYTLPGKEHKFEKCWFQCKRYKSGIKYSNFSTELQKANNQGVKRFFIVSNIDTTSACKDDIKNWNDKQRCDAIDWTGNKFLDILFGEPDIANRYFSDEEIPPVIDIEKPNNLIPLSTDLGNRFGIEIKIETGDININNPIEIGKVLKETLLNLKVDLNIKALVYEKCSMFFLSINQADTAILFLNKSLDITPKNVSALITKGFILEKIDELEESNEVYDEIFELDEKNITALNNKAFNLLRQGDLDNSLDLINRALEIDNKFIPAIKNKIKILKSLERIDEALEFLSKNEDVFEKSVDLMTEKVSLCIEKLDLKTAFELNKKILDKDQNNLSSLNNQGAIYEKNSQYQFPKKYLSLALSSFDKAIEVNKDFPIGWANKTVVLMNSSQIKEAAKIIELAYSLFPKSSEVLNKKGVYLLKKNEPKKAIKYFNSALKRFYRGEFLLNRAKAHYNLRHYENVLKDIERLLKNEPKNSNAWGLKGECLKKLRRAFWKKCFDNANKYQKQPISLLE